MSTDTSVTELVINKLTKTQFEGIQNPSDTELYVVTDASYSYNDLSDKPDNIVTTDTNQDITGVKTFVGDKRIKLEQSQSSDKMGLTIFDDNELEAGAIEFRPNTINNYPLLYMGQYKNSDATPAQYISTPVYVGFRNYEKDTANSITAAYNLVAPLARDAKTPFNLTAAYQNFYLPLGVTDGITTVTTASTGLLNISTLIPSDYVHTSGNETIAGTKTFESDLKLSKTKPEVDLINTDLTKGTAPSNTQQSKVSMLDKDDKLLAETAYIYNRDGETGVEMRAHIPLANSTGFSRIGIYNTANSIYTICPTPTEDTTNSKQIDTVGARNTKLANYVTLSDAETITGAKTFTEGHLYMLGANNSNDISLKFNNVTQGTLPTTGEYNSFLHFYDKNNKALAANKFAYTTSDAYYRMYCGRPTASNTSTAYIEVRYTPSGACYVQASCQLQPTGDNNINLGSSSKRWKQLYAGTTTIATSDERFKQQIDSIPDAVLDAWGEVGFYQYKFNDAVEEKGDNARYHTGMIAQRIKNAFEQRNLDAFKYGLLCFDEWEATAAQYDNDGEETSSAQEAGNRYSLRYEECLCMEAAYQRRRADRIEARLAALEANINKLMGF